MFFTLPKRGNKLIKTIRLMKKKLFPPFPHKYAPQKDDSFTTKRINKTLVSQSDLLFFALALFKKSECLL